MTGSKPKKERGTRVDGDIIRAARKRKGWSQQELADASGVSLRKIGDMEAGKATMPGNIKAVAKELRLTFEELTYAPPASESKCDPLNASNRIRRSITIDEIDDGRFLVTTRVEVVADKDDINGHARKIFKAIAANLRFHDGFDPDDIIGEAGSLKITVPLSKRDAFTLLGAFGRGELTHFKVSSVTISDASQIQSAFSASEYRDQLTATVRLKPKSIYSDLLAQQVERQFAALNDADLKKLARYITKATYRERESIRLLVHGCQCDFIAAVFKCSELAIRKEISKVLNGFFASTEKTKREAK